MCWLLVGAIISDNGVLKTHEKNEVRIHIMIGYVLCEKHFVIHV